jgi:glycosyltransferase involved in cell wall biosynthesis
VLSTVPRVSVVIPVHNGARFVGEAIRSALTQTVPPFECIVVDDGSTDATAEVLAGFGPEVRVLRQERRGVSAARNAGMGAARGDLFAFLDADDVWLGHKLDRQLAALVAHPDAGAVCSGYVITDEALDGRRAVLFADGPASAEPAMLLEGAGIGFSFTGLVTRAAAEATGPFDERLSTSADLEYARRVAQRVGLVRVGEPLALYRQHGDAQMHRDLDRLERDMGLVWDGAAAAGVAPRTVRRGRANLHTYIGLRLLLDGDVRRARRHLGRVLAHDPARVLLHPLGAVTRRVGQDVGARRWTAARRGLPGRGDVAFGPGAAVTPPA